MRSHTRRYIVVITFAMAKARIKVIKKEYVAGVVQAYRGYKGSTRYLAMSGQDLRISTTIG